MWCSDAFLEHHRSISTKVENWWEEASTHATACRWVQPVYIGQPYVAASRPLRSGRYAPLDKRYAQRCSTLYVCSCTSLLWFVCLRCWHLWHSGCTPNVLSLPGAFHAACRCRCNAACTCIVHMSIVRCLSLHCRLWLRLHTWWASLQQHNLWCCFTNMGKQPAARLSCEQVPLVLYTAKSDRDSASSKHWSKFTVSAAHFLLILQG